MPVKPPCVGVAWSGGRDSTALLHSTAVAAAGEALRVVALHVHHGWSPNADAWVAHCDRELKRWKRRGLHIALSVARLESRPQQGESVEAWARAARYNALLRMAMEEGASLVLMAHHRRDQAETLLLQALRGAGVAGLAGMPDEFVRGGIHWARPWLGVRREDIEGYVRRHRLVHIDDESNLDPRFARNRLRLQVWPALLQAFPDAEGSLADASRWAGQATDCLRELAEQDLSNVVSEGAWSVGAAAALTLPRRSNALRHWLQMQLGRQPEATLVTRMLEDLSGPGPHRWPASSVDGAGELRHYRGRIVFVAERPGAWPGRKREDRLSITRAGRYRLPGWSGELIVRRVKQGGVPLAWLAHLSIAARGGGEQFQAGFGRPPRSLKKQFQSAGVPAWAREAPLFYSGGQLVFVPGLGVDARAIGIPGQAQVEFEWQPVVEQAG